MPDDILKKGDFYCLETCPQKMRKHSADYCALDDVLYTECPGNMTMSDDKKLCKRGKRLCSLPWGRHYPHDGPVEDETDPDEEPIVIPPEDEDTDTDLEDELVQ